MFNTFPAERLALIPLTTIRGIYLLLPSHNIINMCTWAHVYTYQYSRIMQMNSFDLSFDACLLQLLHISMMNLAKYTINLESFMFMNVIILVVLDPAGTRKFEIWVRSFFFFFFRSSVVLADVACVNILTLIYVQSNIWLFT